MAQLSLAVVSGQLGAPTTTRHVHLRHVTNRLSRPLVLPSVVQLRRVENVCAVRAVSNRDEAPWEVLGVDPDSSEREIKAAHRKLVLEHHPDRVLAAAGSSSNEKKATVQKRFMRIQEAYEMLMGRRHVHMGSSKDQDGTLSLFECSCGGALILAVVDACPILVGGWRVNGGGLNRGRVVSVKVSRPVESHLVVLVVRWPGWNFHDFFWSFNYHRRKKEGERKRPPPPAGSWRGQMDNLKRRAAARKWKKARQVREKQEGWFSNIMNVGGSGASDFSAASSGSASAGGPEKSKAVSSQLEGLRRKAQLKKTILNDDVVVNDEV